MENVKAFEVQLIVDQGKWPQIGTARFNKNGSLNLYVSRGVTLSGGQKLYLRPLEAKPATAVESQTAA